MRELKYPFDAEILIKKKKSLKKQLLQDGSGEYVKKKIAILGGETTKDITLLLKLFLLDQGIEASFYESEYNQWFEDGMFGNDKLDEFKPDLIYICTCIRNINTFPQLADSKRAVDEKISGEFRRFESVWSSISNKFNEGKVQWQNQ